MASASDAALDTRARCVSLRRTERLWTKIMRILPLLSLLAVLAVPAAAHEFWISPEQYTLSDGQEIKAEIRVGEKFKGPGYAYIPKNFVRFELFQDGAAVPVEGLIGDRPALNQAAPGAGLVTVVHQTRPYALTYDDWETFVSFTGHKDAAWAPADHLARGFTQASVKETYTRFGKSLVAVGHGAGSDVRAGMPIEIVALANPYSDDLSDGLPVQVFYDGAPRADAQVEVFAKAPDGAVLVETYRTDAGGVAVLHVAPGVEYLVDSVVVRPVDPADHDGAMWESLWASLTFRVPGD